MTAKGNVKFNNLVRTIVQHPAILETINSILTASNQEQSTNIVNPEANQINRNTSTNIPSVDSTSNSSSSSSILTARLFLTVAVLTSAFANIYIKKGKKQVKLEMSHSEKNLTS